jgi:NADH-quinone oxidoreductase subunit N
MLVFMLGLAGIPPTAGFMGKLYLWAATVEAGFVVLVVISVIMSAVSLYYYFRIVVQMYLADPVAGEHEAAEMFRDPWAAVAITICAVMTLAIGIWPAPVVGLAKSGIVALGFL